MRLSLFLLVTCLAVPAHAGPAITFETGLRLMAQRFLDRDVNQDGYLDRSELIAPRHPGYPSMGKRAATVLLVALDANSDQYISTDEYTFALARYRILQSADLNNDGILNSSEQIHLGILVPPRHP